MNAARRLSEGGRIRTIVTASAGNLAREMALAAEELGLTCVVFTPASDPEAKQNAIQETLKANIKRDKEAITSAFEASQTMQRTTTRMITVVILVCVGLLFAASMLVAKHVTRSLRKVVSISQAAANGDLTSTIEVETSDELGNVLLSMRTMSENLAGIISQVRRDK